MGLVDWLTKGRGLDVAELAHRLAMSEAELAAVRVEYRAFSIPKRGGGARRILAPSPELKSVQRRILRRVLALLVAHPSAQGFESGRSIATNAARHAGKAVVVRLDLRDFFGSTSAKRVERFFWKIGWNGHAADRLAELCTYDGVLPQGAPTSPRLSNLLNYRLDTRLTRLAAFYGATYTRYADDLIFSFNEDHRRNPRRIVRMAEILCNEEGYRVHVRRKLRIRRRHQRQEVTGLVVNEGVRLPRETRRWLRAVEHRYAIGKEATVNETQLEGWRALRSMIEGLSL